MALVGIVLGIQSTAITAAPSLHLLTCGYCHHGAFPISIVFIRTRSIWPALTHALVVSMSCTSSYWPWTQMSFSSCSPMLSSTSLCWPLPLQERGSGNTHIFLTSLLYSALCSCSGPVHCARNRTTHLIPGAHPYGHSVCAFAPMMNPINFSIKTQ